MAERIYFSKNEVDNLHLKKLKKDVEAILDKLPKGRKSQAHIKTVLLPGIYFVFYATALIHREDTLIYFLCYGAMGITAVLVFLNLVHEAVHGNLFKKSWKNQLILYFFDLIGANSYIWKKRHNVLHHRYQNIAGWDSDIEQASILRIFPHDEKKSVHGIQHWLIFILYPLYLMNWIFVRDFKDYFKKSQLIRKVCKIPFKEYIKLFIFKFLFIFYLVIIPVLVGTTFGQAFLAMIFMIILAGSISLLTLLTPHVNVTNEFPLPSENGIIQKSWIRHQFDTTNDVNASNWITKYVLGNFNFHIAHHLFPKVSSVYAPEVTEVIKRYADDNSLGYRCYDISKALKYHYQLIKNNAVGIEFLEEEP